MSEKKRNQEVMFNKFSDGIDFTKAVTIPPYTKYPL